MSEPMTPEKLAEIRGHIERRAPRCCDIGRAYPGQHREGCPEQVAEDALALLAEAERLTAERDEANALAEAAVAMLRRLEWVHGYPDEWGNAPEECPLCERVKPGHAPNCELGALLGALR